MSKTKPAPADDAKPGTKMRWAIETLGGVNADTDAVLARLRLTYPSTDWDGVKNLRQRISNTKQLFKTDSTPPKRKRRKDAPAPGRAPGATKPKLPTPDGKNRTYAVRWALLTLGITNRRVGWNEVCELLNREVPPPNGSKSWHRTDVASIYNRLHRELNPEDRAEREQEEAAAAEKAARPPLAMHDLAGSVETIRHLGTTFGWDQVSRLVEVLKRS